LPHIKIALVGAVGAVIAVAAVLGGAYLMGYLPFSAHSANAQAAADAAPLAPGAQYAFPEKVITLSDQGAHRYLKLGMSLEFSWGGAEFRKAAAEERKKKQAEFDAILSPWLPAINDAVITLVSARSVADLSTAEGKQTMKADIKDQLNRLLGGEPQVENVLFTQFVMQ
jgi:flagellar protein FliL